MAGRAGRYRRRERARHVQVYCHRTRQLYNRDRETPTACTIVSGKEVTLHAHGKDKYGRTIAVVFLPDGTNLQSAAVQDGWCWRYEKHSPKDLALQQSQDEAKAAKGGLWVDPNLVPSWFHAGFVEGRINR